MAKDLAPPEGFVLDAPPAESPNQPPAGFTLDKPEAEAPAAPQTATITQPPEEQRTAYLPDVDKTIQYPASMSPDRLNDAVQKQVYGRPENAWLDPGEALKGAALEGLNRGLAGFSFDLGEKAGEEPKLVPETGKAVVRGGESLVVGTGAVMQWFGKNLEDQGQFNESDFAESLGKNIKEAGEVAQDFWKKRQELGWEAPDIKTFSGSFLSNPSFTRIAADVAQNVPILAAGAVLTQGAFLAGLSEHEAAFFAAGGLGLLSGGQAYVEAKDHGASEEKANLLGAASTIGNTALMYLPIGKALEKRIAGESIGRAVAKGSAQFALMTAAMTPMNNLIAKMGGDKTRKLLEGMTEAILAAAVTGGILGGFRPGAGNEMDDLMAEAHRLGVSYKDLMTIEYTIGKSLGLKGKDLTKYIKEHKFTDVAGISNEDERRVKSVWVLKNAPKESILPEKASESALNSLLKTGGFTIHPATAEAKTEGWAFSPFKDREQVIPNAMELEPNELLEKVKAYIKSNVDAFTEPDNHIGGWLKKDSGEVFLDVSQVLPEDKAEEALSRANDAEQHAIFNLRTHEERLTEYGQKQKEAGSKDEVIPGQTQAGGEREGDSRVRGESDKSTPQGKQGVDEGFPGFRVIGGGSEENQFVRFEPFNVRLGEDDKQTSQNIRDEFTGQKNEQVTRGNQLADQIRRMVPDKNERDGLFWFKAAQGDTNLLLSKLDNPRYEPYINGILAALDMSPEQKSALKLLDRYYEESGQVGKESGTLRETRDNYMARLYAPDKPQDFVKTELASGIKPSTKHSLRRVFDTEFEAVEAGKRFATTDVADALAIHNEEMARANTSRRMADALVQNGLGAWVRPSNIPDGWEQLGNLKKSVPIKDKEGNPVLGEDGNQVVSQTVMVVPKHLAAGLAAVAEPNFARKIDSVRGIQRYQGLVKTADLSLSFFHHFTMAAQTLYQGGVRTLMHLPMMEAALKSSEFGELEQDFTGHTGITSKIQANQDILRNLTQNNEDAFSKIVNLPGPKQFLQVADKSSELLFDHIQRYLKVSDYGLKISKWVSQNQNATNEEVRLAKIGFAREINATYGGLNWESLGMTKSNLSLLRLGLLAPDWTVSNIELLRYAIGENPFEDMKRFVTMNQDKTQTASASARAHILTALAGGMLLTEGINKMLTGHFTDKNKKGHQLEIEISPDVYVSLLRGGIGDITKASSMTTESGLAGLSRFAQGKLAPFPRTAIGLLTNTQYTGREIHKKGDTLAGSEALGGTWDVLKYALASAGPIPLGASNLYQYLRSESEKTPEGIIGVGTGVARYSKAGTPPKYATHGLLEPKTKRSRGGLL